MAFSDALDREAAWLNTVDSLGNLTTLFQIIQARWPRTPAKSQTGLYVLRVPSESMRQDRFATGRIAQIHHLELRTIWPLTSGAGQAEADQLAHEQAIDVVLARLLATINDKTHGGRFSWVAEEPAEVTVALGDPEQAVAEQHFRASITYFAVDTDLPG